jgi:chromate transport protein ChrA
MITPAFLAIVLLASIFSEIVSKPTVSHIFWGVGIGIIALLFLAVKEMWKKSVNDKFSVSIYFVCLILALSGKVSLSLIIIGALFVGVFWQKLKNRKQNGGVKE